MSSAGAILQQAIRDLRDAFVQIGAACKNLPEEVSEAEQAHLAEFALEFARMMKLYVDKNFGVEGGTQGYRGAWLTSLDARMIFVEAYAKMGRLMHLMWGDKHNPGIYWEVDTIKLYKEWRDMNLYGAFAIRRIALERGIDFAAVAAEERKDL